MPGRNGLASLGLKLIAILAILVAAPASAFAWDAPGLWYWPATGNDSVRNGGMPGGGGILGTGGQHDAGIKCSDCHVQRATESFTFALAYSPALTNGTFAPGQRYTITASVTGAVLPCMTGPNGGSTTKKRGFAASFEDDNGAPAGSLASDSGQSSSSCPLPTFPQSPPPGTTYLDGDCAVIFGDTGDLTSWTFTWTAPASGYVHVYWGAVDSNCDMMSTGDAVMNGSMTLAAPPAAREAPWPIRVVAAVLAALVA